MQCNAMQCNAMQCNIVHWSICHVSKQPHLEIVQGKEKFFSWNRNLLIIVLACAVTRKYSNFTFFAAPENSFDTACASNFWPIWNWPASPIKFKSPDGRTDIWLIILPRLKTRRGLISGKCLVRILPTNQDDDPKKKLEASFCGEAASAVMGKRGSFPNNPIFSSCSAFLQSLPPSSISFLVAFPLIWERDTTTLHWGRNFHSAPSPSQQAKSMEVSCN